MKKSLFYLLFLGLAYASCHQQEQAVPANEIPWGKLNGKIVSFDFFYAIVANGQTKKIDTLLTQPAIPVNGKYHLIGNKGITVSALGDRILYTDYDGYSSHPIRIQSVMLNGDNKGTVQLNNAYSVLSPTENNNGSVAYFTGSKLRDIESVWIDNKKLFPL